MATQSLQIHELIYTSASQLLHASGGHLGIVAQSAGFPRDLEAELATLNGYNILQHFPLGEPAAHPPRHVSGIHGNQRKYYCVSRIVFAGADHTGRTTPLAHHVVIEYSRLVDSGIPLANILHAVARHFVRIWSGPPVQYNPPREIAVDMATHALHAWPADEHADAILTWIDALLQFPATRRPLVFVGGIAQPHMALERIAFLIGLLPPSVQRTTSFVSHVVSPSDGVRDAAIIFTYRDSAFHAQCVRRQDPQAPLLIDMEKPGRVTPGAGELAAALQATGCRPGNTMLIDAMALWDQLQLTPQKTAAFAKLIQLRRMLTSTDLMSDLQATGKQFDMVHNEPTVAGHVSQWAVDAVNQVRAMASEFDRNTALTQIQADERWPVAARELAADALAEQEGVVALLQREPLTSSLQASIRKALAAEPALADMAFESLMHNSAAVKRLLSLAKPDLAKLPIWAKQLVSSPAALPTTLNELIAYAAQSLRGYPDFTQLQESEASPAYAARFLRPVLQAFISRAPGSADAQHAADELIRMSLTDRTLEETIHHLQSERGFVINSATSARWINLAAAMGQRDLATRCLAPEVHDELQPLDATLPGEFTPPPPRRPHPGSTQTAGPRILAYVIAGSTLALCGLFALTALWVGMPFIYMEIICVVTALYLLIDLLATMFWRDDFPISQLRIYRRVGLVLMIILFAAQAYLFIHHWNDIAGKFREHKPPSPQSRPAGVHRPR